MSKDSGVTTVLLTGKGEPTLFPDQITDFMRSLEPYQFPFVEIQTNGVLADKGWAKMEPYFRGWYGLGMTTVAVSIAHYKNDINAEFIRPNQSMRLSRVIRNLHSIGLSVRLSVVMERGGIDSVGEVKKMVTYAKRHKVEQLTIRPVSRADHARNHEVAAWIDDHLIPPETIEEIGAYLHAHGTLLLNLMHGAQVFDYRGQNICLTNCLTHSADPDEVRQLIFFPDGHLRYSWSHPGAILL